MDLEKRDPEGRTILLALAHGWSELGNNRETTEQYHRDFDHLLERDADYTVIDNQGRNILHYLANCQGRWRGNVMIETILKLPKAPDMLNAKDNSGKRPIHFALSNYASDETPTWLLHSYGADICGPDIDGSTALHHILGAFKLKEDPNPRSNAPEAEAVPEFTKPDDVYTYLVRERGLDINAPNESGNPALFKLMKACPAPAAPTNNGQKYEPFESDSEFLLLLKKLIGLGMNVHALSASDQCALHALAVAEGRQLQAMGCDKRYVRELWKHLVECGLDPWKEDRQQRSALDIAASTGHLAIMEMY